MGVSLLSWGAPGAASVERVPCEKKAQIRAGSEGQPGHKPKARAARLSESRATLTGAGARVGGTDFAKSLQLLETACTNTKKQIH